MKKPRENLLDIKNLSYVSKSISLAGSLLPNITCLVRVAVLKIIFSETEHLQVVIGINKNENNSFASHAWATFDDVVILNNEPQISSYKAIYRI